MSHLCAIRVNAILRFTATSPATDACCFGDLRVSDDIISPAKRKFTAKTEENFTELLD